MKRKLASVLEFRSQAWDGTLAHCRVTPSGMSPVSICTLVWVVLYHLQGEPVGLRFVQMVSETSGMGNYVRDKHVPFVQFTLIYRESGTSLTIGAGSGTGRKQ